MSYKIIVATQLVCNYAIVYADSTEHACDIKLKLTAGIVIDKVEHECAHSYHKLKLNAKN